MAALRLPAGGASHSLCDTICHARPLTALCRRPPRCLLADILDSPALTRRPEGAPALPRRPGVAATGAARLVYPLRDDERCVCAGARPRLGPDRRRPVLQPC